VGRLDPASALVIPAAELNKNCTAFFLHLTSLCWPRLEPEEAVQQPSAAPRTANLKVHKIEIFFGFDFEICHISLLVMSKY
jgi:hypothetical protein